MKITPPKTLRPTASADRPGDDAAASMADEARTYAPRRPLDANDRGGLFSGGATLH